MTPEQAKQIAEREYPYTVHTHFMQSTQRDFNHRQDNNRNAFIKGLMYDKWIKVTPETMPEEDTNIILWCDGYWCEGYLNRNGKFYNIQDEQPSLEFPTHYQYVLTPPKPDNV
jgi:hypothetical protein